MVAKVGGKTWFIKADCQVDFITLSLVLTKVLLSSMNSKDLDLPSAV